VTGATLVLPTWIADEIGARAQEHDEAGAVLLVGLARTAAGIRLLGREVHWVPPEAYDGRTSRSLLVRSSGYVDTLARAESTGTVPIWLHTHPGTDAKALRSEEDLEVDDQLIETFRVRSGADVYASLVVAPAKKLFQFSGFLVDRDSPTPISRTLVVGARWSLLVAEDAEENAKVPDLFDRQIRAFGGDVQRVLSILRVGIVGCGGTGSAVAEQLVRLGIRSFLLIDPDRLTISNVTRVYGSTPADIGRPKVDVASDHLRGIAPSSDVHTIRDTITHEPSAQWLTACDVVFGCTDDNAGRLVLSRLASFYLVPVIDLGVLLSSTDGQLEGIDGRITVLSPGEACLVCRDRVDLARAQAEQLDPDERQALQAEGYAPELAGVEPAVVSYTSLVASLAVAELLERLIGYGPNPEPSELLIRCHERELSTNSRLPRQRHYCHPDAGVLGRGDQKPFLELTWRAD
jgi:molybdopterin/thiamine biosynthesis adenylyltransferase